MSECLVAANAEAEAIEVARETFEGSLKETV
jgi:hypothetical protein